MYKNSCKVEAIQECPIFTNGRHMGFVFLTNEIQRNFPILQDFQNKCVPERSHGSVLRLFFKRLFILVFKGKISK